MKIKDICVGLTDGSHNPPQNTDGGKYLMLSSKNVFDDLITLDDPRYLSDSDFEQENKRTQIEPGDVLLTIVGTVGRTAVVPNNMPQFTLQRSVAVLHVNPEITTGRFLMYALRSKRQYIESRAKGVAQKGIYLGEVSDIEIPMPNLSIQEDIVERLDAVSKIADTYHLQLQKLDELIKARFVEMFGDPVHNTANLPVQPMTEICEIIDGDRGKSYPKQEDFFDKEYCLFLNAKNVTNHGFDFSECMFITKEKDNALKKGKLKRGDVVLTTRGTLGNLAFYTNDVPFDNVRINSGMVILRMDRQIIDEDFFIEQFRMLVDDIKKSIASGSAQPQLPISTMNKINIVMPDLKKQKQFSAFVSQVDKSKATVQAALDETQLLFDSLMQKYFG